VLRRLSEQHASDNKYITSDRKQRASENKQMTSDRKQRASDPQGQSHQASDFKQTNKGTGTQHTTDSTHPSF
jgi:hypothetical protein